MKKSIFILGLIFLLSGCRDNYLAEKEFWKAEKQMKRITKEDFKSKGPDILNAPIAAFEKVSEKYPGTPKAVQSLFVISNLKIRQKRFDEAIHTLEKIVQNYSDQNVPEARYGIAELYETKGEWRKAEEIYWETAEYHPLHQKGLFAPIHLIIHYKKEKDEVGLRRTFDKSVEYYNRMLKQLGPIQASGAVKNYLGVAYLASGKWEEARKTWISISDEYPQSPYAPIALLAAAELSWKKKDIESGIKEYEDFIRRYPANPLVAKAQVQLGLLHQERKEYDKSRETFQKALSNLKEPSAISDVKLLIARSYQDEGKWTEAEAAYKDLKASYPNTNAALQVPLLIAMHYQDAGDKEKSDQTLDEALKMYNELAAKRTNSDQSLYLKRLQNSVYAQKGDWNKMLESFDESIKNETSDIKKGNWLYLKALVTDNRMQDKKAALDLYASFLNAYPEHPLAKSAKSRQSVLLQTA